MRLTIVFSDDEIVTVKDLSELDKDLRVLQLNHPFIKSWNIDFKGAE